MANNQLLASDNFASGSLAAGWALANGLTNVCKVVSGSPNVTEPQTTSETDGQVWTGLSWPLDQISELTINAFTNESTTEVVLLLRWQAASTSGYEAILLNDTLVVRSVTSGSASQIGSTVTGLTIAAGDIWSFHAEGAALSVYQNFALVFQAADTAYLSWAANGCPGFFQYSNVNVAHCQVSSWRGYSAVQQDGVWQKQGIVIPALAADFTGGGHGIATTSQVLREGNAQILSGTVYKIWFCGQQPVTSNAGGNIGYAESLDGINWTRYSPYVLSGYVSPTVWKLSSTYYMFAQPITGFGTAAYAVLTSPDGINWTLKNASGVGLGSAGAWDDTTIFGCGVVAIISGTWYALYYGNGTGYVGAGAVGTGVATSTDGINWTKHVGNPVIANFGAQQAVYSADNVTFYVWGGEANSGRGGPDSFDPAESVRYKVSNRFTTWTSRTVGFHDAQGYELVNGTIGQSWLNAVINIGGKTYGYTTSGNDGSAPLLYQVSLVVAPVPLASVVTANEDAAQRIATDSFARAAGALGANWTPLNPSAFNGSLQIVSGNLVEAAVVNTDAASVYTGASFSPNQYSEITVPAVGATNLMSPVVRGNVSTGYGYWAVIQGPTGTADTSCYFQRYNGTVTQLGPKVQITTEVGDVLRLQIITGSDGFPTLSLFQNGYLILQAQDQLSSPVTSGNPGMYINVIGSTAASQISLWAGGNANVIPTYGNYASTSQPLQVFSAGGQYSVIDNGAAGVISTAPSDWVGVTDGLNFDNTVSGAIASNGSTNPTANNQSVPDYIASGKSLTVTTGAVIQYKLPS